MKVVGQTPKDKPVANQTEVACPNCGNVQIVYADVVVSVTVENVGKDF